MKKNTAQKNTPQTPESKYKVISTGYSYRINESIKGYTSSNTPRKIEGAFDSVIGTLDEFSELAKKQALNDQKDE